MIRKVLAVLLILGGVGVASESNVVSCVIAVILAALI